jgi:hypothetical protein
MNGKQKRTILRELNLGVWEKSKLYKLRIIYNRYKSAKNKEKNGRIKGSAFSFFLLKLFCLLLSRIFRIYLGVKELLL